MKPLKIIIRAPNHLGDCVMALPMINNVREAHPGSEVTVLAPAGLTELFESNPAVDQILPIPAKHLHGLLAVIKIKEIVSPGEYDLGYILPPSFGSAASLKLAGVKKRIGYIADGRRMLLTKPLPLPEPLSSAHRYELYLNLLRRSTDLELEPVRPKLFLSDDDAARAINLLAGFDIAQYDQYLVVAFRAVAESRRWGTENYTELIRLMVAEHGLKAILIGSPDDQAEGEKIIREAGLGDMVINMAGKTSLRELAAIISRASVFVGNDSGPAHLAAAVGVPLVVISGADDPAQTSPVTPLKRILRREQLECIACVKNKCPLNGDEFMRCMSEISVEQVADALSEIQDSA